MTVKQKVTAFVLRRGPAGTPQILLHSFATAPIIPLRLPGGGVDAGEVPEAGLWRELREESGLTDLHLARKLGVHAYFKAFTQSHVERHDFLLWAPAAVPAVWEHQVSGAGADRGDVFRFRWLPPGALTGIDAEHRAYLTREYIPELFAVR